MARSAEKAVLGEYKLRDLNDDINKLVREKNHWEDHIKVLGGPDFKAEAPKMLEREGKEVPGNRGYRYYGAARDLPGVRELFEEDPQPPSKKSRGELMKLVDVAYYGNCDEDDGVILPQEIEYEKIAIERKMAKWRARKDDPSGAYRRVRRRAPPCRSTSTEDAVDDNDVVDDNAPSDDSSYDSGEEYTDSRNIYEVTNNPADDELMRLYDAIGNAASEQVIDESSAIQRSLNPADTANSDSDHDADNGEIEGDGGEECSFKPPKRVSAMLGNKAMSSIGGLKRTFIAHVPVPTQEQMEAALLRQRKQQILDKYMSQDLLSSMNKTGELLGFEPSPIPAGDAEGVLPAIDQEERNSDQSEHEDELED